MSAGFMYANQTIYKKDLRHIYSGQPPTDVRFRVRNYHSGIDHMARLHEIQTRRRVPREPPRQFEYLRQYGIALPRAPAFKKLSKPEVDELVKRLNSSKNEDEKKMLEQLGDTDVRIKTMDKDGKRALSAKYDPMSQEKIDIDAMIQRLYYNGSTHVSKLRQRETFGYRLKSRPNSSTT